MEEHERTAMIESLQCGRDEPTQYVGPPERAKGRTAIAAPLNKYSEDGATLPHDHANVDTAAVTLVLLTLRGRPFDHVP
jgi:hypothetical protein